MYGVKRRIFLVVGLIYHVFPSVQQNGLLCAVLGLTSACPGEPDGPDPEEDHPVNPILGRHLLQGRVFGH